MRTCIIAIALITSASCWAVPKTAGTDPCAHEAIFLRCAAPCPEGEGIVKDGVVQGMGGEAARRCRPRI